MRLHIALFSYGGISGATFDCLMGEILHALAIKNEPGQFSEVTFGRQSDDALISRMRSVCASRFLDIDPPADVLFMLDHDLEWNRGDLLLTAKQAHASGALVAGMYSCRKFGQGHASRLSEARSDWPGGSDLLLPADFLGAGFLAIPRSALEAIIKDRDVTTCLRTLDGPRYHDFFRPIVIRSPLVKDASEYLSEDWAFSFRAREAGVKCFVYAKPYLVHHGDYGYRVIDGIKEAP